MESKKWRVASSESAPETYKQIHQSSTKCVLLLLTEEWCNRVRSLLLSVTARKLLLDKIEATICYLTVFK